MSYILVDENGKTADLATNQGLQDLYSKAGPQLKQFLDDGEVTESDREDLIAELELEDDFDYIAEAMVDMDGDIILSNGIEDESDDVEKVYCPTGEGGGIDPTCSPGESGGGGSSGGGRIQSKDVVRVSGSLSEPDAGSYHYHATNLERAHDIANQGKLVPHGPSYGTDQTAWPDGSRQKRSYFGTDKNVWQFAPEEGQPVVLRVKRGAADFKAESTGDIYVSKPIKADYLEILTHQGWQPLKNLRSQN